MSADDPAGWRESAERYGAIARDGVALGMDDLAAQAAELAARHGLRVQEWEAQHECGQCEDKFLPSGGERQ